jgi:hypothetical protein
MSIAGAGASAGTAAGASAVGAGAGAGGAAAWSTAPVAALLASVAPAAFVALATHRRRLPTSSEAGAYVREAPLRAMSAQMPLDGALRCHL